MSKTLKLSNPIIQYIDGKRTEVFTIAADKIIKMGTNIIGCDDYGNELFAFHGISDFSQFSLSDDAEWDTQDDPIADLQQQNAQLLLQLAEQEQTITDMQNQNAAIMLQLAGGIK